MKKNIIANFAGRFWGILSNFLFIPLYIKYLGFESYSIISFTLVVAGIMAVLDAGLTATLSREFAHHDNNQGDKKKIFSTLESLYFIVIFFIIIVVFLLSTFIANKWINTGNNREISLFLKIISFDIGFQLLFKFYLGGLLGLEKQVKANAIQILWGVLRNGLVVLLIYFIPRLDIFFLWQSISTIFFTIIIRSILTKELNNKYFSLPVARIKKEIIVKVWKFAGGMLLISIVAVLSTQIDKLLVSSILPIEELGYYTLAVSLGTVIIAIVNPIATALLPRFTLLFSANKNREGVLLFKTASIYTGIIIACIAAIIIVFSYYIIWIWTGDWLIANKTTKLVSIMALAYASISLQVIPFNIVIANGYTKLNNILGLIGIAITIPSYWILINKYGALGAATVFSSIQIILTIIYLWIVNLKFLKIKKIILFSTKNIFLPLIISLFLSILLKKEFSNIINQSRVMGFILLVLWGIILLTFNLAILLPTAEKSKIKLYLHSIHKIIMKIK